MKPVTAQRFSPGGFGSASSALRLPRIALLGAGIKGCSTSAMLAASGRAMIFQIEPYYAGSGISSTNHGRFHSGVWNYLGNSSEIIRRNTMSRELVNQLPDIWESLETGFYCVESEQDLAAFQAKFDPLGMKFPYASNTRNERAWIDVDGYSIVEVPETSFNPASMSDRLLRSAQETKRCVVVPGFAERLTYCNGEFTIYLSTGETVEVDAVVNAMGGWTNDLQSDLSFHRPNLKWSSWRLLCVNTHSIGAPLLNRVLTIDRCHDANGKRRGPLAAVPHESWIVFGCDIPAIERKSQDEVPPGEDWRPMNLDDEMDHRLWSAHADHFPILRKLVDWGNSDLIYSFSGVYPSIATLTTVQRGGDVPPPPYKAPTSWVDENCPGYYPFFGGSATSALLDAREVSANVLNDLGQPTADYEEWISRIAARFPAKVAGKMIWENHRIRCASRAA